MKNVILISGKAQHGKDTLAMCVENALSVKGERVVVMHYAGILKFMCKMYLGWDGCKDEEGRAVLQEVGTDIVRKQNPDFWATFLSSFVLMLADKWDYVIIADVRFKNEIDVWEALGVPHIHIRVHRTNYTTKLTEEQQQHPSEVALDNVPYDYGVTASNVTELNLEGLRVLKEITGEVVANSSILQSVGAGVLSGLRNNAGIVFGR